MKKIMTLFCAIAALIALVGCTTARQQAFNPEEMALKFEDVAADDWFYGYVVAGMRFGLIEVASEENPYFEPDRYVTQGEFITMLGRLHEYGHEVIGVLGEGGVYERYIDWALEIGIVHMYEYWDFAQDELMTREQMAVAIYNYTVVHDLHGYLWGIRATTGRLFSDYMEISYWARVPVHQLRNIHVVSAKIERSFVPHDILSRAEAIQSLVRVGDAVYDLMHPY